MLTEERQEKILDILNRKGSVTASELMAGLDASESTIRRDISALAEAGKLKKVHGGAIAITGQNYSTKDDEVALRKERNIEEKLAIAKYAASLIEDHDFIYLDAGTTTMLMIDFIEAENLTFVTNAIEHARLLTQKGYKTYILGGEFKAVTDAIVGEEALASVDKYNFTKGFFGTNGIHHKEGLTTPEVKEALLKKKAIAASREAYALCDSSKFGEVAAITFADIDQVTILTDKIPGKKYKGIKNIMEVVK